MKWTHSELIKSGNHVSFDEDVEIEKDVFKENTRINDVKEVHVDGQGYLDDDKFYLNLHIQGVTLIPDAITGKEIEYPFETSSEELFCFEECDEEEAWLVENDTVDIMPAVITNILLEVPLQVTNAKQGEYPSGDGWRVVSEEEYQKSIEEQGDPRLAILKEFKNEE